MEIRTTNIFEREIIEPRAHQITVEDARNLRAID